MIYYNNRYYNPNEGIWSTKDKYYDKEKNNLYNFTANSPIIYFDYLGNFETYVPVSFKFHKENNADFIFYDEMFNILTRIPEKIKVDLNYDCEKNKFNLTAHAPSTKNKAVTLDIANDMYENEKIYLKSIKYTKTYKLNNSDIRERIDNSKNYRTKECPRLYNQQKLPVIQCLKDKKCKYRSCSIYEVDITVDFRVEIKTDYTQRFYILNPKAPKNVGKKITLKQLPGGYVAADEENSETLVGELEGKQTIYVGVESCRTKKKS